MPDRPKCIRRLRALVAAGGALVLPALAAGQGQGGGSPFLPPGFGAQAAAPQPSSGPLDSLEFRGVLSLAGKTFVTLFDTSNSRSFTAEVGETVNNVKVAEYSVQGTDDTVLLESGGRSRRLQLRKAKIVALAVPPPTAVPLPQGMAQGQPAAPVPFVQQGAAPGTITQMSDEEVRQRMQRVAEEIRRRRAVRREMLENAQQSGNVPQ